ncbi:MAG: N-acetylmuramoyl-L-alanine amidase [Lachnospiraceae bacterium]|nr:N-acetylmuramoyl-L-alanine amidase [Lachnospiraceae bacterium]
MQINVQADEPVIVVIDPGHGGKNLGAEYDEYTEKDMTLIVARAMKEELEKYDDIIVYLTHDSDVDMSIKDRALFAKERNADFLFCLHFNSSVNHNLYGAEVWVSAFGDYYIKGRQFAEISMDIFEDMGLYSRGIKTRLNDKEENYYGILRYCTEEGIPAALIEHCHLDQENDKPFYQRSEEQLEEFGRKDAEAVAKYFGLKSAQTGVDYSDFAKVDIPFQEIVRPDRSEPEVCEIEVLNIDEESGTATISMHAEDSESYILYYSYSLDGGYTYTELSGWPRPVWDRSEPMCLFDIQLPFDKGIELRAIAYNGFDVVSESNIIDIPPIAAPKPSEEPEAEDENIEYEDLQEFIFDDVEDSANEQESTWLIVLILIISLIMAVVFFAMIRMLFKLKRYSKRRR